MKYYSLSKIDKTNAVYRMIYGERSNGKTFAVLEKILETYALSGKKGAYIRRWDEDVRQKRMSTLFSSVVQDSKIWKKYYADIYDGIKFYSGKFYLYKNEDEREHRIVDEEPFCYSFSLSAMEHDKSTSYPDVSVVCFDEFLTRRMYLPDEFVIFMNTLSTIIRQRTDVVIYMLGNTVNKTCPYFQEMGLTNVKNMKEGTIDVYSYGNSELTVAVEYAKTGIVKKTSAKYFAFNNPKLQMITGGSWEVNIYPHCPCKYKYKEIEFTFFIEFDGEMLQCELINKGDYAFMYIHRKTTPLKDDSRDIIYSTVNDPRYNWRRRLCNSAGDKLDKVITYMFKNEKVFYQDNEVGEIVRNYLLWSRQNFIKS